MLYTNPDDSDIERTRAFPALNWPPDEVEELPQDNETEAPPEEPAFTSALVPSPAPSPAAVLAERLYRLRPDRLILAGGSIAAVAAVLVGFATASGASTPAHLAPRPAVCATPNPGR